MEILQQHKNGTLLQVIKTYEEMDQEEIDNIMIAKVQKIEDYKTYKIDRNKKGEIIRVYGYSLSDEEVERLDNRVDFVDQLATIFGTKKQKEKAQKRINRKKEKQEEDINVKAVDIIKNIEGIEIYEKVDIVNRYIDHNIDIFTVDELEEIIKEDCDVSYLEYTELLQPHHTHLVTDVNGDFWFASV